MRGITPRMVSEIFSAISHSPETIEWRIKITSVEIYMEKVRDLIDTSKNNLKIRESATKGIYIEDVTEIYVGEEEEVYEIMRLANNNRVSAYTNMNEGSSRSHLIFLMHIYQYDEKQFSAKSGKLFLVDLAGSEKVSKSGVEGKNLDEARKIN
jgi:kinesin family protein 5